MDEKTGFKTRNILCMPIFDSKKEILAVGQLCNKKDSDRFSATDENSFEVRDALREESRRVVMVANGPFFPKVFAAYCGLALQNARLYDQLQRDAARRQVRASSHASGPKELMARTGFVDSTRNDFLSHPGASERSGGAHAE